MHFLLSNDDGYLAPGLKHLHKAVEDYGRTTVLAPDRDRSGASNSLTLDTPLRVFRAANGFYFSNGTPTDCVHLAITGLLADKAGDGSGAEPDMVISGINQGANLGDDVLYSGTVAAAMEGRFLGYPAVALSLAGEPRQGHYDTAVKFIHILLPHLLQQPLSADTLLNINIPDVPWAEITGIEVTRLGSRHRAEAVIKDRDPKSREIYWLGSVGSGQDAGAGTDFHAIANRRVAITPLRVDLTRQEQVESLKSWAEPLQHHVADSNDE